MAINSGYRTLTATNIEGVTTNRNYVQNNFENGTTIGWSLFNTTLTSGLPTGTISAGASSLTLSTTTTNPLSELTSLQLTSAGAVTAGQGFISDVFIINRQDQAKVLFSNFMYEVVLASNANFSGLLGSQTIAAYIYDVTNSVWIQPAGFLGLNQSSGPAKSAPITFQTNASGAGNQYQLAIVFLQATTGAVLINFDNFNCGPEFQSGGIGSISMMATSNTTSVGSATTPFVFQTVIKDRAGAYNATTGRFTVPVSGDYFCSINGSITTGSINVQPYVNGGPYNSGTLVTLNATAAQTGSVLVEALNAGDIIDMRPSASSTLNSACSLSIFCLSSSDVSSNADTRVIDFTGTQSSQSVTANVTDIAFTTTKDSAAAWNGTQYVVGISGEYVVTTSFANSAAGLIEFVRNGSTYGFGGSNTAGAIGSGCILISGCKAGDTLSVRTSATGTITSGNLGVFRLSGPAVINASESVNARYFSTGGQTIGAGVETAIFYATKSKDTHNAYNISTGIYTAPISGTYLVTAQANSNSTNVSGITVVLTKNSTDVGQGPYALVTTGSTAVLPGDTVYLNAGDTVTIKLFNNNAGSIVLTTSNTLNFFNIVRVGN